MSHYGTWETLFTCLGGRESCCFFVKQLSNQLLSTIQDFQYIIVLLLELTNCLPNASATRSSMVRVGFSEHRTTKCTLRSPCSSSPLASTPTLITPFSTRGAGDGSSFFFGLQRIFVFLNCVIQEKKK